MGLEMAESSSSGASSPSEEIHLPDAPETQTATEDSSPSSPAPKQEPTASDNAKAAVNLENLFDDDDLEDDDLIASSGSDVPLSPPQPTSSAIEPASSVQNEKYTDPNIMLQFYARLFPFRSLFHWLNAGPKPSPNFTNREFALTLSNDAYLRYQSYPSADLLKKDILKLNPSRFEIGPVYTSNPRDRKTLRKSSAFKPLSKEIVFDIDLTDYDDIRTCCTKANICSKCWPFASMAIKVVDAALREDFGFEHIMWVYSGRRGVHAWISDKAARELDDEKRRALTGYFEVVRGNAQSGKRVNVKRPLHPHLARSVEILSPYFRDTVLVDQDPFASAAGTERLLTLLNFDTTLQAALKKKWTFAPERPSVRKWKDIDELASSGVSKNLDTVKLKEAKQDILLEYTYPRLDVEVGKKRIHLLKSPFVVHPGTGRVCVPISGDASKHDVDEFDPFEVPKVTELLGEVDTWQSKVKKEESEDGLGVQEGYVQEGASMRKVQDWEKTRLKPYIEVFEKFVRELVKDETVRVKREREEDGTVDGMEF
jgi:DNA primase small subunit